MKQTFTLLAVSLLVFAGAPARAEEAADLLRNRRSVTVQGEGKVMAVPDIATLSAEVSEEGDSLDAVSEEVRRRMRRVLDALKGQGIADKDVQTQLFQVQPRYERDKRGNPQRAGFVVTNRVAAKVRDLNRVGRVLAAVVNAGATSVQGPEFGFDDPRALERKALALAMEDARAKAAVLAGAAGASAGEALTVHQAGGGWPGPRPMLRSAMAMEAKTMDEPIAAGEQAFTSHVTATFALK